MNNYNFVHDEGVLTITVGDEQTARDVLAHLVKVENQWSLDSVDELVGG